MHILMLSLDTTLLTEPEGNARARHLAYAAHCGRLTIIVRSTSSAPPATVQASDALTLLPSRSRHPALYPWDAWRAGRGLRGIDLIVAQDQFTSGLAGVWLRGRLGAPLLVQNHTTIFDNRAWLAEKPLRNRALLALAGYVRARTDFLRTVNQREADAAVAAGLPAERAAALPLGVVSDAFSAPPDLQAVAARRAAWGLPPRTPVILWVGYPVVFKRVPLLFEVFARVRAALPEARLLLVGDLSRSPDDLPALAAHKGLADSILMPGPVAHDDLPAVYALADVYAHTSSYEGVPRVLMEAASLGRPIAAMRAPGVDEILTEGVTGCLTPDGDTDALAQTILALLADRPRAAALGAAARQMALERYGAAAYAERWVGLWRQAVVLGRR